MKRRFLTAILTCMLSVVMLSACGSKQETPDSTTESVTESTESSGGSVSLDASGDMKESIEDTDSSETEESTEADLPSEDAEVTDVAPVEKPETIRFVIVQNARDKMFTLTNAEDQTLTIDTGADAGYTGTMEPKAGEYETGGNGYYTIPYSSTLTLSDMDDDIVYVSAEYPNTLSVAVQNALSVIMKDDRSVVIQGKDNTTVFSYHVWMPSAGITKESSDRNNEVMTGQGSGSIKLYWDGSKVAVQQLSGSEITAEGSDSNDVSDSEDSDVATVDWQTACPWADKIATGVWSDGADLSNVKQLASGIMSAKFTPVDDIEEDAKVVDLTFYDIDHKKLGVLKFWQKGNHVEIDGKKFDYDTFGLDK